MAKRKAAPEGLEMVEHRIEDTVFTILLLFSGLIAIEAIALLLSSQDQNFVNLASGIRLYVLPWVVGYSLLAIGRELWMTRVYFEHINLGYELKSAIEKS